MKQPPRLLARITSMRFQVEAIDRAFDHFRQVSAPLVRGQAGSLGILGSGNPESGFAFAISFWSSREDLERSNGNPAVVEAMGGYAQWMAGPFLVESYTIASGDLPASDLLAASNIWMRTTWVDASPGRLDDLLAVYEARLDRARASSPSCVSTLLLTPLIGQRLIAIEFWSSHSALTAWEAAAKLEDQRLWRAGGLDQPPVRDTLTLFGIY